MNMEMRGSVISSATGQLNYTANLSGTAGDVSTMFFGTVSGGLSAELTGEGGALRKCPVDIFSERASQRRGGQGAATGLTVSGLNHVAHRLLDPKKYILSVLSDTEGANNAGHAAVAIDHPDGTTKYVSKDSVVDGDGDGNRDNGGVFGPNAKFQQIRNWYWPSHWLETRPATSSWSY